MSWSVWGYELSTAEATGTTLNQKFKIEDKNQIIRVARCWYVFYNNPVFTSLKLRLYTSVDDSPSVLIAESTNSWIESQIYDASNNLAAVAEVYFEFNFATLRKDDFYHAVTYIDGYTNTPGFQNPHIAWKTTFPDPPYKDGLTLSWNKLLVYPLDFTLIGSELK